MACINPDGTITETGKALLRILQEPLTPEEISQKSGQPLFKIRSSLREMAGAGLVREERDKYVAAEEGKKKI
jgi:predicted transcriptional regulator